MSDTKATPGQPQPASASTPASTAATLQSLIELLDLEPIDSNLFRGPVTREPWRRVYGGQVLGQALVAATRTVPSERRVHSLHAYFILAGDPKAAIIYDVEAVRDGGSFTTRRVKAIQHGRPIFVMSASFQKHEVAYDHQVSMPDVPPPEGLMSETELKDRIKDQVPENARSYWSRQRPIEMRPVSTDRYVSRAPREPVQHVWLKAAGRLPDDPALHEAVLAYASDFTLLDTSLIPHGKLLFDADIQMASLDHAIWFHRPFRADEWMLYAQDSPNSHGARGFCRGSIYSREGVLIASVAQEGLVRRQDSGFLVR